VEEEDWAAWVPPEVQLYGGWDADATRDPWGEYLPAAAQSEAEAAAGVIVVSDSEEDEGEDDGMPPLMDGEDDEPYVPATGDGAGDVDSVLAAEPFDPAAALSTIRGALRQLRGTVQRAEQSQAQTRAVPDRGEQPTRVDEMEGLTLLVICADGADAPAPPAAERAQQVTDFETVMRQSREAVQRAEQVSAQTRALLDRGESDRRRRFVG
jgi:hypothetical protein